MGLSGGRNGVNSRSRHARCPLYPILLPAWCYRVLVRQAINCNINVQKGYIQVNSLKKQTTEPSTSSIFHLVIDTQL